MTDRLSDWQRFKLWIEDLRIAHALRKLRRSGELERILGDAPYTITRPGSSMGDDYFDVYHRDRVRQGESLFASTRENHVLWWIVQRQRAEAGGRTKPPRPRES